MKDATLPPSGFTTMYTDPGSGITLPEAWIQITNILYVPANYNLIVYDIYVDETSYLQGKAPVFPNNRHQSNFGDEEWDNYFDPSVMAMADHDIQSEALSLLQTVLITAQ